MEGKIFYERLLKIAESMLDVIGERAAKSLRLTSTMTTKKLIRAVDSMAILLRTMKSLMKLVQTYNL